MVEMDLRFTTGGAGLWNDDNGQSLYFPVCEVMAYDRYNGGAASGVQAVPPMVWGTGQTASFNVKVCIDHVDTLFFQVSVHVQTSAAAMATIRLPTPQPTLT